MTTEQMTQINETPETAAMSTARRRALEDRVVLLAPSFGWFRGQYQLPIAKTTIEVDGKAVENGSVTTPRSKLMTDKFPVDSEGMAWKKRLQKIESRQRALIEKHSVPFPIRGVRIIPKAIAADFFRELDDIKRDLQDAADAFVADLSSIIDQIRDNTNEDVWRAIEHKIPKQRHVMRAKFYIDVVPVEIAGRAGENNVLTQGDLERHSNMINEACRRKVDEAIETMIEQPRAQLGEALASLRDLINRNGRVSEKSFKPVYEAMKKLRAFSFVANDELLDEINNLERRMQGTTANTLDQVTAASNGFAAALDSLMEEVEDAERQAQDMNTFGREYRGIQLD